MPLPLGYGGAARLPLTRDPPGGGNARPENLWLPGSRTRTGAFYGRIRPRAGRNRSPSSQVADTFPVVPRHTEVPVITSCVRNVTFARPG